MLRGLLYQTLEKLAHRKRQPGRWQCIKIAATVEHTMTLSCLYWVSTLSLRQPQKPSHVSCYTTTQACKQQRCWPWPTAWTTACVISQS